MLNSQAPPGPGRGLGAGAGLARRRKARPGFSLGRAPLALRDVWWLQRRSCRGRCFDVRLRRELRRTLPCSARRAAQRHQHATYPTGCGRCALQVSTKWALRGPRTSVALYRAARSSLVLCSPSPCPRAPFACGRYRHHLCRAQVPSAISEPKPCLTAIPHCDSLPARVPRAGRTARHPISPACAI